MVRMRLVYTWTLACIFSNRSDQSCFSDRYSEFDTLRQQLRESLPHAKNALPALPPKSVLCTLERIPTFIIKNPAADKPLVRFRPSFLESRRVGLEYFLK